MKICAICKTPIEVGLDVDTKFGPCHMGGCLAVATEHETKLNESGVDESRVEEIQMIL